MVLSYDAEAKYLESGEKLTEQTLLECSSNFSITLP